MYTSILLPIDLGHTAWKKTLPTAISLARSYSAQLHLMTVLPDFGMSMVSVNFPADFEKNALAAITEKMDKFKAEHVPDDVKAKCHVAHGSIYAEIMQAADHLKCDLIVVAAHRPEMRDYLLGSNASRIVRHAKQSVFVVRD